MMENLLEKFLIPCISKSKNECMIMLTQILFLPDQEQNKGQILKEMLKFFALENTFKLKNLLSRT